MSVPRIVRFAALTVFAMVTVLVGIAAPAAADEPGESDESRVLVQQAIALIVNTPDDHMAIAERIDDALEAPHAEGVDLATVEKAKDALAAGDLALTRSLLQTAIGAGPYVGEGVPPKVGETSGEPGKPAVGAETGTSVVLDEFDPAGDLDGGDLTLLGLSVLAIVAGLLLVWRFRPEDTVRQLRRRSRAEGKA